MPDLSAPTSGSAELPTSAISTRRSPTSTMGSGLPRSRSPLPRPARRLRTARADPAPLAATLPRAAVSGDVRVPLVLEVAGPAEQVEALLAAVRDKPIQVYPLTLCVKDALTEGNARGRRLAASQTRRQVPSASAMPSAETRTRTRPSSTHAELFAAACERSITRPRSNGPRSLIRTITERPVGRCSPPRRR